MEELIKEESLGDILRRYEIVTDHDVQKALEEQKRTGCRFGEALVALGIVTAEDIDWALSNQLNIPYVRLSSDLIDLEVARSIPASLARKFDLIPLVRTGDELRIAMVDPLNATAAKAVEDASGCKISVAIALKREVREMLDVIYGNPTDSMVAFSSSWLPEVVEAINADPSGESLVNHLFDFILENKLTSLSLQRQGDDVVITVRNCAGNRETGRFSSAAFPSFIKKLEEKLGSQLTRNGICTVKKDGVERNLDVFMVETTEGPFVTLKPAVNSPISLDFEQPYEVEKEAVLKKMMGARSGLILVASRSPKERAGFISQVLMEYEFQGKQLFQVGDELAKGGAPYPKVIRQQSQTHEILQALLEHNPDVIALEDISDHNSLMVAGNAAMRRRLIIGGVSCHGATQALRHIYHSWQKGYFLPACLRGIVACTTVPLLCEHCKEEVHLSEKEKQRLTAGNSMLYGPRGCKACGMTGYSGRRFMLEIIPFDDQFRADFEKLDDGTGVGQLIASRGYQDLSGEGRQLLMQGLLSPMDYLEYVAH